MATVTVILWVLLLRFWLVLPQGLVSNPDPCTNVDLQKKVPDPCEPCETEDWLELILYQRADKGPRTTLKCFNNLPLGTNTPTPIPEPLTKGYSSTPNLNLEKTPRGFEVTRLPFLRFNTRPPGTQQSGRVACENHNCPYTCDTSAATSPPPEDNLDFSDVGRYFETSANQVDLQLIEWPGKNDQDTKDTLEENAKMQCTQVSLKKPISHCLKYKFPRNYRRLKFHKESSKLLHYPCNKEEGTQISALGLMAVQNRDEKKEKEEPENSIYLAYDKGRIFHKHTKPLYVSDQILNEMAKPDGEGPPGICRVVEPPECNYNDKSAFCVARQKYFEERGEIIFDDKVCTDNPVKANCDSCKMTMLPSDDLRTVLDFTFVQGKLILAMRCGILVVDDILVRRLDIYPAELITPRGTFKHSFKPVAKIVSNHCCDKDECRQTIIAGYPAAPKVNTNHEIYISYDLGRTFAVKYITEPHSALNLMLGLYKMYEPWLLYYHLLEQPDPEDLKHESGKEVHPGYEDLRSKPDWDSLTTEEKETKFIDGDQRQDFQDFEDEKNDTLRYVRLRIPGSLGRFIRKRSEGEALDLDLSPKWLQEEIRFFSNYRTQFGWHHKWTDSNCDSIPQCREKFEDDSAVKYFLGASETIVKTPKKDTNVPFCDQIVSLAVLEEQDALYVLCLIGFGDFSIPKDFTTDPPCSSRQSELKFDQPTTELPTTSESTTTQTTTTTQPTTTDSSNSSTTESPTTTMPPSPRDPATAPCIYRRPRSNSDQKFPYNPCVNPVKYYAIYTIYLHEKLPLALVQERRSERLFTCANMKVPLDWSGCKSIHVQPDIIRVPNSISLLVQNCKDVLYYSPNGGRTMFNTEFYAHYSEGIGQSGTPGCNNNPPTPSPSPPPEQRQLMYRLNSLKVPPQINISPLGNVVLMTMRNVYAYGLLGGNKGFRMIVGKAFPDTDSNVLSRVKTNSFVFPSFTVSGQPFFGVAIKLIYTHHPVYACQLYHDRSSMRLVHMDPFLYKDAALYYNENQDLLQTVRELGLGVDVCHTRSFKAKPKLLRLDVGENEKVEVSAMDLRPNIPLSILSSEEKSNTVEVSIIDRDAKADEGASHVTHDWDVNIHSIRNYKKRVDSLIHTFFGIENSNMYGFSTQVSLANDLGLRCHNQPTATIRVHTECRNKKLMAHEDMYRPQCTNGTFSKDKYTYILKKGTFDPHMVSFFMEMDKKEGKKLITLDKTTGDLHVVYDYIRFGCPLEPYKDEEFIPDLRVVTLDNKYNTSLGKNYTGPFLIMELFGTKGFYFTKTFEDQNCPYIPINLTQYIQDWVHRKRMFRIAYGRQTKPSLNIADIVKIIMNATKIEELRSFEEGNKLFYPDAVDHPINIINRVTYRDCRKWRSFFLESENSSQDFAAYKKSHPNESKALEKQQFPILKREGTNTIKWKRNSQPIYIFMAIALDPSESICEYYTIFGVSIPSVAETQVYITLGLFLILVLLWLAIFLCGYAWRKARIREMCIDLERKRRLEEAAWKVVYRYEKLLQENENRNFEEEFEEFKELETEKQRIRQEQKELIKH